MLILIYLALGAAAGTAAGLFGVGGGLIIVPTLIYTLHWQGVSGEITTHMAVGTSLATIVVTSLSSVWAHHKRGAVDWQIVRSLTPGIVLGSVLGGITASYLTGPQLQLAFGLFVLLIAAQMGLGLSAAAQRQLPGGRGLLAAGAVVGWVSALFGIGGGSLTVPFLSWCNVVMQRAVACSAACGLPIALFGSLTYMWQGQGNVHLPGWTTGFVYWPAFFGVVLTSTLFARVGANLAHRLSPLLLRRIFALFLLVVGSKLISGSGLLF
jgi:hypothetical protein